MEIFVDFLQFFIDGVLRGMLYGLIALGFVVIYRAGRIFNFAQGEVVILCAYFIWTLVGFSFLPPWLALVISFALALLLGLGIERVIFRPLIGQDLFSIIMVTVGLMIMLQGLILVFWGGREKMFPAIISLEPIVMGSLVFTRSIFYGGILSLFIFLCIWLGFEKTRWGLKLNAVAEDHQIAQSMGISVKKSVGIAWMLGCVISNFAAVIFLNGSVLSTAAASIGIHALPVVLLAGLESVWGTLLAGIIIGVGESLAAAYLDDLTGGGMSDAFPYLIMLAVLLVRPQGLFGWKIIERV